MQGCSANGVRVGNRLFTLGGIYNQIDLAILHHIDDMRPAFHHLVDHRTLDTISLDCLGRTPRSNQLVAFFNQFMSQFNDALTVDLAHTQKSRTTDRDSVAGAQLGLGKGLAKGMSDTHHFTGRLHFRPQQRIDALELDKREHGFLDGKECRLVAPRSDPAPEARCLS